MWKSWLRMQRMQDLGVIRRIAAVPNHYAIGYTANGMSVWDVPDEQVDELGERVGALECVSHCYRRPRHLPELAVQPVRDGAWPLTRGGGGEGETDCWCARGGVPRPRGAVQHADPQEDRSEALLNYSIEHRGHRGTQRRTEMAGSSLDPLRDYVRRSETWRTQMHGPTRVAHGSCAVCRWKGRVFPLCSSVSSVVNEVCSR